MAKTQPEPIRDPKSDRLLTPENCALVLIDYQPEQYRTVTSSSVDEINLNVIALCKLARAYDLPRAERDGGFNTVNSTGAVYRLITDFSNLDKSVFTLGPGQSGQPGSPHYGDLLDRWNGGGFFPLHYSREAVVKNTRDTLVLQPAGGRSTGLMRSGAGPTDLPAYNEGVQERQPTP